VLDAVVAARGVEGLVGDRCIRSEERGEQSSPARSCEPAPSGERVACTEDCSSQCPEVRLCRCEQLVEFATEQAPVAKRPTVGVGQALLAVALRATAGVALATLPTSASLVEDELSPFAVGAGSPRPTGCTGSATQSLGLFAERSAPGTAPRTVPATDHPADGDERLGGSTALLAARSRKCRTGFAELGEQVSDGDRPSVTRSASCTRAGIVGAIRQTTSSTIESRKEPSAAVTSAAIVAESSPSRS
jgi:hypothetical protein